jgi:hypothetical protein
MFKFLFGSPLKKLEKAHAKLMEDAMHAQRNGNMALYAELSSKAEEMYQEILKLKKA